MTVNSFLRKLVAEREMHAAQTPSPPVNGKWNPPPPLVEQIRAVLETLPPSHRNRISAPAILPHLQGRYGEHPHLLKIGQALRRMGYRQVRVWSGPDTAHRFWVKESDQQAQDANI